MVTSEAGESLNGLAQCLSRNDTHLTKLALIASARHGHRIHQHTLNLNHDLEVLKAAAAHNRTVRTLQISVTGKRFHSYLCAVEACMSLAELQHFSLVLYGPFAIQDVLHLLMRLCLQIPHNNVAFQRLSIEFKAEAEEEAPQPQFLKPSPVQAPNEQQQQQQQQQQVPLQQERKKEPAAPPLSFSENDLRQIFSFLVLKLPQLKVFVLHGCYHQDDAEAESNYLTDSFGIRLLQNLALSVQARNNFVQSTTGGLSPMERWQQEEQQPQYPSSLRTAYVDLKTNHGKCEVHWEKDSFLFCKAPMMLETWLGFRDILQHVEPIHLKFNATLSPVQLQRHPHESKQKSNKSPQTSQTHQSLNQQTPPHTPDSSAMDLEDYDDESDDCLYDNDDLHIQDVEQAIESWCDDLPNYTNLTTVEFRGFFSQIMTPLLQALVALPTLQSLLVESFPDPLHRREMWYGASPEERVPEKFFLEKFPNEKIFLRSSSFRSSYWDMLQQVILDIQPPEVCLHIRAQDLALATRQLYQESPLRKQQYRDNAQYSKNYPIPDHVTENLSMTGNSPSGRLDQDSWDMDQACMKLLGQMPFVKVFRANISPHAIIPCVLYPFCAAPNLEELRLSGAPISGAFGSTKKQEPGVEKNMDPLLSSYSPLPLIALEQILSCESLTKLTLKHFCFVDDEKEGTRINNDSESGSFRAEHKGDDDCFTNIESTWCESFVDSPISEFNLEHCILTRAHSDGLVKAIPAKKNLLSFCVVETRLIDHLARDPLNLSPKRLAAGILTSPINTAPHRASKHSKGPFLDDGVLQEAISTCIIEKVFWSNATAGFFRGLVHNNSICALQAHVDASFLEMACVETSEGDVTKTGCFWHTLAHVLKKNNTLRQVHLRNIEHVIRTVGGGNMAILYEAVCSNHCLQEISFHMTEFDDSASKEKVLMLDEAWRRMNVILKLNKAGHRLVNSHVLALKPAEMRARAVAVLSEVNDDLDALFVTLQENPQLCEMECRFTADQVTEHKSIPGRCISTSGMIGSENTSPRILSGQKRSHHILGSD